MSEDNSRTGMDTKADTERNDIECVTDPVSGNDTESEGKNGQKQYWWLVANPKYWTFKEFEKSQRVSYSLENDEGNKRRIYQNFLDAKVGDIAICYESSPKKQIVATCRVCQEQDGKEIFFEEVETLSNPIDYAELTGCQELEDMEFFKNPQGTLFKLREKEYKVIDEMIRKKNPKPHKAYKGSNEKYTEKEFLQEVYMSSDDYKGLVGLLKNKKNIILQGPPGVGKTFAARRLAWSMMGKKDDRQIEFIQFHQNYAYEDFMMGYKPDKEGFQLQEGVFYRFCDMARKTTDDYFFIIDEINRGNVSKIFGEALMLIEEDHRGEEIKLPYKRDNGEEVYFSVPKNLYIIGMMNTADRSLAFIDYALRRRFSFFDMKPAFGSDGFNEYQKKLNSSMMNNLISTVSKLNEAIKQDSALRDGFCIGHSYFCGLEPSSKPDEIESRLKAIVRYDILPLLKEYWFDNSATPDEKECEKELKGFI